MLVTPAPLSPGLPKENYIYQTLKDWSADLKKGTLTVSIKDKGKGKDVRQNAPPL